MHRPTRWGRVICDKVISFMNDVNSVTGESKLYFGLDSTRYTVYAKHNYTAYINAKTIEDWKELAHAFRLMADEIDDLSKSREEGNNDHINGTEPQGSDMEAR